MKDLSDQELSDCVSEEEDNESAKEMNNLETLETEELEIGDINL